MAQKIDLAQAATEGASVFDLISRGNVQTVQNVNSTSNVKEVKNVSNTKEVKNTSNTHSGRPLKYDTELTRLNLKVPAYIKEYLTIASAKQSIAERRQISLTEYLIELVKADMDKNKDK